MICFRDFRCLAQQFFFRAPCARSQFQGLLRTIKDSLVKYPDLITPRMPPIAGAAREELDPRAWTKPLDPSDRLLRFAGVLAHGRYVHLANVARQPLRHAGAK